MAKNIWYTIHFFIGMVAYPEGNAYPNEFSRTEDLNSLRIEKEFDPKAPYVGEAGMNKL